MKKRKAGVGTPAEDLARRWREAGLVMQRCMPQAFEAMLAAAETALSEIAFADAAIDKTYH